MPTHPGRASAWAITSDLEGWELPLNGTVLVLGVMH